MLENITKIVHIQNYQKELLLRQEAQDQTLDQVYQKTKILEVKNRVQNLRFPCSRKTDLEDFRILLQEHFKMKGSFPEIDQIYRNNSRGASENKLPWNILVKFTQKKTRYFIWNKLRNST